MKKLICTVCAALLLAASFAGCGEKKEEVVSHAGSAVSGAMSDAGEAAEDIGQGVSGAASAAVSNVESMWDNGEVSDGDGLIGNETTDGISDETSQPETVYEDILEDNG